MNSFRISTYCHRYVTHMLLTALVPTGFEQWSASEREAMDADGNGAITRSEQQAYLKRIGTNSRKPAMTKRVALPLSKSDRSELGLRT
jgi:hypothetical protein